MTGAREVRDSARSFNDLATRHVYIYKNIHIYIYTYLCVYVCVYVADITFPQFRVHLSRLVRFEN